MPKEVLEYGQWPFLTNHTLVFQIITYFLHVLAFFSERFVKARDFVFTALAFPLSITVFSFFWGAWFIMGRELIFPKTLDEAIPPWLNHCIHTVILPMNLALVSLVAHKFFRRGSAVLMAYSVFYLCILNYVKYKTGFYIYLFLDTFSPIGLVVFFVFLLAFTYCSYLLGEWMTRRVHGHTAGELVGRAGKK